MHNHMARENNMLYQGEKKQNYPRTRYDIVSRLNQPYENDF